MSAGSIELASAAALPLPQGGALPTSLEWQALERMATMLAGSSLVPYRLRNKPGDVAVILLAAREYGVPPLMALSKLPVVNGTPAPMGELMVALILRAGHKISVKVYPGTDRREADGTLAEFHGGTDTITEATYAECTSRRAGDEEVDRLRFTMAEAIAAGLVELRAGKPWARVTKTKDGRQVEEVTPWEVYTVNMLRWRAVANAARLRFPDVLLGLSYLPEELGAMVDAEGAVIVDAEGDVITVHDRQGPRQPAKPAPTLESRTAAEFLEQAYRIGDTSQLDNGYGWAERNGLLGELVDVSSDHREALKLGDDAVNLGEVLAALKDYVAEGNGALVIDAQPTAESAPEEPAKAASTPETPAPGAQEPPAQPAPENGAQQGPTEEEFLAAVHRTVTAALETTDVDVIRRTYTAAGVTGRAVNIAEDLTDDDRNVLGIEPGVAEVAYGALLMAVAGYLERHGTAVRAPIDGPVTEELPVEDPPGDDSAALWPDPAAPYPL